MVTSRLTVPLALLALAASACGKKDVTVVPPEGGPAAGERPVDPPRGWRVHEDERAGFAIALPRRWSARDADRGTRVQSGSGALVASLQADRSAAARETAPDEYAQETFAALPGYRRLEARPAEPPASPYPSARLAGTGVRERGGRRQRVSVTAFHLPGEAMLVAVAFSDPGARAERRTLDRALASLRPAP